MLWYSVLFWVICPVYADPGFLTALRDLFDGHSRFTAQTNRLPWNPAPPQIGIEFASGEPNRRQPPPTMQLPVISTPDEYQRLDPAIQDELRRTTILPIPAGARDLSYQELAQHAAAQPSFTEVPRLRGTGPIKKILAVKSEKDVPGYVDDTIQPTLISDPLAYARKHINDYFYPQSQEEKEAAKERAIMAANNGELVTYIHPKNFEATTLMIFKQLTEALGSGFIREYGEDYVPPQVIFVPNVDHPPRLEPIRHRPQAQAAPLAENRRTQPASDNLSFLRSLADSDDLNPIEQERLRSLRLSRWEAESQQQV